MPKKKTAIKRKEFQENIEYLNRFEEGSAAKFDQLRHDLEEAILRVESIKVVFVRELTKSTPHCNRAKHTIQLVGDIQVHTEIQKELIGRQLTTILLGNKKQKKTPDLQKQNAAQQQEHQKAQLELQKAMQAQLQAMHQTQQTAVAAPQQADGERRVEGLSMPCYHGHLNESIGLYIHRVQTFFSAKNLNWKEPNTASRCLSMVVANLKGQAAAWYQELASRESEFGTRSINSLPELEAALRKEFEPDDLQERLRDKLFALQQKGCKDLFDYIEKFRRICTDVRDMSERDKVTFFIRGLRLKTREEVKYRQCQTLSTAIKAALEFERSHAVSLGMTKTDKTGRWNNNRPAEKFQKPPQREKAREPDDMEVDNVNVRGDRRPRDNSNTRCFNCNEMGHIARRCKKPKRRISGQAPSRQSNIEVHDEEVTIEDVEYMTFGHYDASEAEEETEPQSEKPL
ncbi:unnamed protein product, partial [Aphanomyces euteiches]